MPGVVSGALLILKFDDQVSKLALGILTGGLVLFIIGCLNGSLTSGTGLFVTLWLVHWFGLDYKEATPVLTYRLSRETMG